MAALSNASAASEEKLFGGDGYSASDIFLNPHACTGYTYDDLIMLPGQIAFGVEDVSLDTKLTKKISLHSAHHATPNHMLRET